MMMSKSMWVSTRTHVSKEADNTTLTAKRQSTMKLDNRAMAQANAVLTTQKYTTMN